MNEEAISEGIRRFAENSRAKINKESDLAFEVTFPGEDYFSIIGIEGFGYALSYTTPCGVIPNISWAAKLLQHNWGSVESTGFYYSVHLEDRQPVLFLETLQYIGPNATSEQVASVLGTCTVQCRQAREALNSKSE